jgi:hypothetical protein
MVAARKAIVRQIIARVMVAAEGASEHLQITIEWVGDGTTSGMTTRPISRIENLSDYPFLCERIKTFAHQGYSASRITACLAQEGFHSPKYARPFGRQSVIELMRRLRLHHPRAMRLPGWI